MWSRPLMSSSEPQPEAQALFADALRPAYEGAGGDFSKRYKAEPGRILAGRIGEDHGAVIPLLQDREMEDGRPTAFSCRDFTCSLPLTDPEALGGALENDAGKIDLI